MTSEQQALLDLSRRFRKQEIQIEALTGLAAKQAATQAIMVGLLVDKGHLTREEAAALCVVLPAKETPESLLEMGRLARRKSG